jgi:hypothetical protein
MRMSTTAPLRRRHPDGQTSVFLLLVLQEHILGINVYFMASDITRKTVLNSSLMAVLYHSDAELWYLQTYIVSLDMHLCANYSEIASESLFKLDPFGFRSLKHSVKDCATNALGLPKVSSDPKGEMLGIADFQSKSPSISPTFHHTITYTHTQCLPH